MTEKKKNRIRKPYVDGVIDLLVEERKSRNLSQYDMMRLTGVPHGTISQFENKRVYSYETLLVYIIAFEAFDAVTKYTEHYCNSRGIEPYELLSIYEGV